MLLVLVVLGLMAAVAVASGGSTPSGTGGTRRPADWILDIGVSLFIVMMAFGAVLWIVLMIFTPSAISNPAKLQAEKRRRGISSLIVFGLLIVMALGISRISGDDGFRDIGLEPIGGADGDGRLDDENRYRPRFATAPVLVTLALLTVAATAAVLAFRARRPPREASDAELASALADVLDDTLDDIRAERDPRRAVIVSYARFERVLAWYGAPRHPAEAPDEYLERMLLDLEVPKRSVTRLTALFAMAKFSQHDVDAAMKDEAIEALETTRDVLRAADEREQAQRAAAFAATLGGERA